eukprot:Skav218248  [mRNA]  locus=scaffold1426:148371:149825:- [translate_table: standard]
MIPPHNHADRLPTCPFCAHTFATFPGLRNHLELNRCPARRSDALTVPPNDLDRLRSSEWGTRVLNNMGNWEGIVGDVEACDQLGANCALCGMSLGRMQEASLRYKRHPDILPYLQPIAQQVIHLLKQQDDSHIGQPTSHQVRPQKSHLVPGCLPRADKNKLGTVKCGLCQTSFNHPHVCTMAAQLAGIFAPTQETETFHSCMICHEASHNLQDLQLHLLTEHGFKTIQWDHSRDALRGEAQCRHCLTKYFSMTGLKQHIQQGRCSDFNLRAPPAGPNVDAALILAFWSGQLQGELEDPRMRLAHTCQMCERQYERSADLAVHFQQAHADLYHGGMRLQKWVIQMMYGKLGCLCAPTVEQETAQHVCPLFMQVAMIHVKYRIQLFSGAQDDLPPHAGVLVPGYFEPNQVEAISTLACQPPPRMPWLAVLCGHSSSQLWLNPDICQVLRCKCAICGHGPMTPEGLRNHLLEVAYCHDILHQLLDPM